MKTKINNNERVADEIFGISLTREIAKAKHALNDFAGYIPALKKDQAKIIMKLDACTCKGQASMIMSEVRRKYL